MHSVEALVESFRQRGLKVTPQRRAIFELLAGDMSHPTAEELYQRLLLQMPDVSRMTVYNTLHELVSMGEIVEVQGEGEAALRYDPNTGRHHHLVCLRCHTILDVDHDVPGQEVALPEVPGYRIVRRQVTFYGYCPNCQPEEGAGAEEPAGREALKG